MKTRVFFQIVRSIAAISMMLFLVSCGGGDGGDDNEDLGEIINIAGTWDTYLNNIDSHGCIVAIAHLNISQDKDRLTIFVDDYTTPVKGTISGDYIDASALVERNDGSTVNFVFQGPVSQDGNTLTVYYHWELKDASSSCYGNATLYGNRTSSTQ